MTRHSADEYLMQTWIDRRRSEFQHTPVPLRMVGAIGWALVALIALERVR